MGKIRLLSRYHKKLNIIKSTIPVTNWRIIYQLKNKSMILVLANMEAYIIFDITIKELENINKYQQTIEKMYNYHHSALPCNNCLGFGKLDWIETVCGKENMSATRFKQIAHRYRRNTEIVQKLPPIDLFPTFMSTDRIKVVEIITSQPSIKGKNENLCSKCDGTGIYANSFKR